MRVAILSDIHDHVWNLAVVLEGLREADALICCGDLCSPFVVDQLARGFERGPVHIVFGNNDGDLYRITQNADKFEHVHLHGELFVGELGGKRFVANHYHTIARVLGTYGADVICYGHNHAYRLERREALVLNPGAVMGFDPVKRRDIPATFMIYDTQTDEVRGYQVAKSEDRKAGAVLPYEGITEEIK